MPPLKVEYAKSGRSRCTLKECNKMIDKGQIRIGTGSMMPGADELSFKWRHVCCFTKRQLASVASVDSIDGYDDLAEGDQALLRRLVKGELIGKMEFVASTAPPLSASPAAASPKKKRARADAGELAAPAVPVAPAAPKGPCPYAATCFRTNAEHLAEYSHPPKAGSAPSPIASPVAPAAAAAAAAPALPGGCPFGDLCFRADPVHRRMFHTTK
jgi:hypothetical protein